MKKWVWGALVVLLAVAAVTSVKPVVKEAVDTPPTPFRYETSA